MDTGVLHLGSNHEKIAKKHKYSSILLVNVLNLVVKLGYIDHKTSQMKKKRLTVYPLLLKTKKLKITPVG